MVFCLCKNHFIIVRYIYAVVAICYIIMLICGIIIVILMWFCVHILITVFGVLCAYNISGPRLNMVIGSYACIMMRSYFLLVIGILVDL